MGTVQFALFLKKIENGSAEGYGNAFFRERDHGKIFPKNAAVSYGTDTVQNSDAVLYNVCTVIIDNYSNNSVNDTFTMPYHNHHVTKTVKLPSITILPVRLHEKS